MYKFSAKILPIPTTSPRTVERRQTGHSEHMPSPSPNGLFEAWDLPAAIQLPTAHPSPRHSPPHRIRPVRASKHPRPCSDASRATSHSCSLGKVFDPRRWPEDPEVSQARRRVDLVIRDSSLIFLEILSTG